MCRARNPPPHQAVRKLRNGILEERKRGSRTPRRQRKRAISKLWRSFFQGRRLARSFRTVCCVGGYAAAFSRSRESTAAGKSLLTVSNNCRHWDSESARDRAAESMELGVGWGAEAE